MAYTPPECQHNYRVIDQATDGEKITVYCTKCLDTKTKDIADNKKEPLPLGASHDKDLAAQEQTTVNPGTSVATQINRNPVTPVMPPNPSLK